MIQYSVIILCAGSGSRTGLKYNKMFYKIENQTIYEKTLSIFIEDKRCKQIIVVCKQTEVDDFKKLSNDSRIEYCVGGNERQDSVYNGLQIVNNEYVLIHDGARPFIEKNVIEDVCQCLSKHNACLVMVPSKDTIKEVVDGKVVHTPNREHIMQAQTPQAFLTSLILSAYQKGKDSNFIATDDASLVENFTKEPVYVVLGSYANKKITTIEDLS